MKKKLIIIAALLMSLASCTYTTTNSNHSSKGAYVPVVHSAPVVVHQPAPIIVRPVYYNTVVEPPIFRRTVYTYSAYGTYCE